MHESFLSLQWYLLWIHCSALQKGNQRIHVISSITWTFYIIFLEAYSSNCIRTEKGLYTVYTRTCAHIYRYNWKATTTKIPWKNDEGNFEWGAVYKKQMDTLASIQHVHAKTTSTSGITINSSSNFPCCSHTGLHGPTPHLDAILGGIKSFHLP